MIEELVAVNPNLVIANISGNAYAMPWLQKVPAILHISYLGTMGGASIADVISGKVNPSGKLPYSFPVKLSDCSAHFLGGEAYPGIDTGKDDVSLTDYLGDPVCSVVRPLKELKHFTKVEVEPDETVQVEFVITPDDLKFFDEASHRWIAEPGVFNVYVGTSSADIRCMHSFKYICD